MKRLLLVSSSVVHGSGFLDRAEEEIRALLGAAKDVLFVPWALHDHDAYAEKARERFARMGLALRSIHEEGDPASAARRAGAFFVGGGNTFRLLRALQETGALGAIRERVLGGAPYVGSSAGSNVACPTIRTTKDMPIVAPRSFESLGLVPFQISPHYLDADPASTHMGETQEERILQFHEEDATPVAGLREGAMLRVEGERVTLVGTAGARLFRRGEAPREALPGEEVGALLSP